MKFWRLFEARNKSPVKYSLPLYFNPLLYDTEVNMIKKVFKDFIIKFKKAVKNSYKVVNSDENNKSELSINIEDQYINLPFGVIDRFDNYALCYNKINGNWVMYTPNEMCDKVVRLLLRNIDGVKTIGIVPIRDLKDRKYINITYEFIFHEKEIKKIYPEYNSNDEYIYCKFDFRYNTRSWNKSGHNNRKTTVNINNMNEPKKYIEFRENGIDSIKLAAISLHAGRDKTIRNPCFTKEDFIEFIFR